MNQKTQTQNMSKHSRPMEIYSSNNPFFVNQLYDLHRFLSKVQSIPILGLVPALFKAALGLCMLTVGIGGSVVWLIPMAVLVCYRVKEEPKWFGKFLSWLAEGAFGYFWIGGGGFIYAIANICSLTIVGYIIERELSNGNKN